MSRDVDHGSGPDTGSDPQRPTLPAAVQDLLDRQAIAAAVGRYCRGVDRLDEQMLRSAYHPDGYDDHGEFKGTVDEFVSTIFPLLATKYLATSHNITNQLIELDGDTAFSESYVTSVHDVADTDPPMQEIGYARYLDHFARREGDWRIVRRMVVLDSRNAHPIERPFMATDEARLAHGRRDRSDPSYRFRGEVFDTGH